MSTKELISYIFLAALVGLLLSLLTVRNCNGAEVENTLWKYQGIEYDVVEHYGFYEGDVYLVIDRKAYQFPNTLKTWAYYTDNIAVMYSYNLGSWGCIISDFNKRKANQIVIATFIVPMYWEYDLIPLGELFK